MGSAATTHPQQLPTLGERLGLELRAQPRALAFRVLRLEAAEQRVDLPLEVRLRRVGRRPGRRVRLLPAAPPIRTGTRPAAAPPPPVGSVASAGSSKTCVPSPSNRLRPASDQSA